MLCDRGEAQHGGLLRARHGQADLVEPRGIDVDVTRGTSAFTAAVGVDAWHVVVYRAAHHRRADRHIDLMAGTVELDVSDFCHVSVPRPAATAPAARCYRLVAYLAVQRQSCCLA